MSLRKLLQHGFGSKRCGWSGVETAFGIICRQRSSRSGISRGGELRTEPDVSVVFVNRETIGPSGVRPQPLSRTRTGTHERPRVCLAGRVGECYSA